MRSADSLFSLFAGHSLSESDHGLSLPIIVHRMLAIASGVNATQLTDQPKDHAAAGVYRRASRHEVGHYISTPKSRSIWYICPVS